MIIDPPFWSTLLVAVGVSVICADSGLPAPSRKLNRTCVGAAKAVAASQQSGRIVRSRFMRSIPSRCQTVHHRRAHRLFQRPRGLRSLVDFQQ